MAAARKPRPPQPPGEAQGERRQRDAERSRRLILAAARTHFAEQGLSGTRLDAVAQEVGLDKRLIYYYFGSKERLFVEVLVDAIADIRREEIRLNLQDMDPVDAVRTLIRFSWDYYLRHPEFLRLINTENLHQARHLAQSDNIGRINEPLVESLAAILERGRAAGVFRGGVDPLQLYISIVGLTYYYVSNRHTLALMFKRDLMTPRALAERLSHVTDVILGYLLMH
ncbi:TetR/AcrR family transcriptional regulator [Ramlibacter sp. MAHUQ-53]|uniref:TetR/AcrR family transcriptional regulator n=1 Tax=unclassified Ramlibacter TaxID=2617605 RepID=UPI00362FB0CB